MAQAKHIDPVERAKAGDAGARAARDAKDPDKKVRNDKAFNSTRLAVIYGGICGVLIGIFQVILNAVEERIVLGYALAGFLVLIPAIWIGLNKYRQHLAAGEVFKNGILFGFQMSITASSIGIIISTLGYAITQPLGIDFGQLMATNVFLVVLGMVIGMIFTFIILQGIKSDAPADEFVEQQEGHA